MSPLDSEERRAEDARVEYQVIADHHTHLIGTRFTIAGLYLAAMGLLLQQVFSDSNNFMSVIIICLLGMILTSVISILELRTRRLIGICAERMQQIERDDWQMGGRDWYKGYMSRIHQTPPPSDYEHRADVPYKSRHERHQAEIFGIRVRGISHSVAFDILYSVFFVVWIILGIYFYFNGPLPTASINITARPSTTVPINFPLPTRIATYTPSVSIAP